MFNWIANTYSKEAQVVPRMKQKKRKKNLENSTESNFRSTRENGTRIRLTFVKHVRWASKPNPLQRRKMLRLTYPHRNENRKELFGDATRKPQFQTRWLQYRVGLLVYSFASSFLFPPLDISTYCHFPKSRLTEPSFPSPRLAPSRIRQ